ncbi:MAG: NFACT family protein [Oscillospiraceae bacterium]
MSLDGALLHCVKEELSALVGARVDKIYQPSREEVVLSLRMLNSADRAAKKLIFSANGTAARVNLTSSEFENPSAPPMFCMLLRKHLSNGKLTAIRQDGLERILCFDFECVNEIGDLVTNTLISEIMGRHSNIILVRDGRVVDSVKRVADAEFQGIRRILPNIPYETPPRVERLNILETKSDEIVAAVSQRTDRLAKALPDILEGISPVFAREAAFYAAGDTDIPCGELTDDMKQRLREFLDNAKAALQSGKARFTLLNCEALGKRDICFVDVMQYGSAYEKKFLPSANELLDSFFEVSASNDRNKQRAKVLLKTVNTAYERVSRKLEIQRKELAECSERDKFRVCGDLINANIYRLEKGMTTCTLEDFYTGEPREVPLDARLTPAQNAQRYYAEYRKLCNAEEKLSELIKKGVDELKYLDSVLDCLMRTESDSELSEIRRELREQGYIRGLTKDEPKRKLSEPMKFRSTDGFEILVGKNNRQNDQLTLKTAKASDIWLHTQNIAGSHVIVRTEGRTPTGQTLFEAAQLAAYHSKGRSGSGVPVDYTAVKFVKKPAGAKPGMVIFTNNKTLFVTPSEELVNTLKVKERTKQ